MDYFQIVNEEYFEDFLDSEPYLYDEEEDEFESWPSRPVVVVTDFDDVPF